MKNIIKISIIFFLVSSESATAQKVKYSKKELIHLKGYYFNEGFQKQATKKISTVVLKDGSEQKGYCYDVKTKKSQIHTIILKDSVSGDKESIPAENITAAYLFASGFEKFGKVADQIGRLGTSKRTDMKKATTKDEIYFFNQSVSQKTKK